MVHHSALKIGDARSIRRADAASIFKAYDGGLNGCVKVSNFGFIFKDLVENKHISSKLFFRDVVSRLDEDKDGNIYLNAFITWIEQVIFLKYLLQATTSSVLITMTLYFVPLQDRSSESTSTKCKRIFYSNMKGVNCNF